MHLVFPLFCVWFPVFSPILLFMSWKPSNINKLSPTKYFLKNNWLLFLSFFLQKLYLQLHNVEDFNNLITRA